MKGKALLLDNYDSFAYNIIPIEFLDVYKNSNIGIEEIYAYKKILLAPGPGLPSEAHVVRPLIRYYYRSKSILGVCLGQQAIVDVFGGKVIKSKNVYHGVSCKITIVDSAEKIFDTIPTFFTAGRYHSWIVSECNFPLGLKITARGPKGEIMALRYKSYNVVGIQFHPESLLTQTGKIMLNNWLNFPK